MRVWAVTKRIIIEMLRDKRTIAMMFIAPLFVLTLMNFLFTSNNNQKATLAVHHVDSTLVKNLPSKHLQIKQIDNQHSAETNIRTHDYAGVLTQQGDKLQLTLQNSDQTKTALILQGLKTTQVKLKMQAARTTMQKQAQALQQLQGQLGTFMQHAQPQTVSNYQLHTKYLYGSSKSTFFDTLLPIMIGFMVFFFVFLISGVAFLGERTSGTLSRVLATPIRKQEIIIGYIGGYGLFAVLQSILIVCFSIYAFKIQLLGNILNVVLIAVMLALVALTLGLLISTFADSAFQMVQFIPLVVIPQIFFSGIIPINQMAGWIQPLAKLMPLYYGSQAITDIIQKGVGLSTILPTVVILALFALVFYILNVMTLRKYRRV
ncbi:ABC transporter permease [Fructilactobacillus carniphilus]|uniref:ABC transporter permease n=1 Tax=Fructilactobacillus carniphilus TaxID=2940297 RepID=A0ABY5BZF7_9LACO|nr:ABC transporter permease [Fructilactobacillus carniphilus]USS90973.1 ABC transporter permease [Fructilactobacillus carniphilus]